MRTINNTKCLTLGFFENVPARCSDLILLSVVIAENFFGLVDAAAINIAGVLNVNLLWQLLLLVLSVVLYWKSLRVPGTKTSVWQGFFSPCSSGCVSFPLIDASYLQVSLSSGGFSPKGPL